jgi:hypothetical protein
MTGIYLCGTLGTVQKTQIMIGFKVFILRIERETLERELIKKHSKTDYLYVFG